VNAPYYQDDTVTLWHGDSLDVLSDLEAGSVDCCVTSPPYFGLRDYGEAGQYGLEASPAEYVENLSAVFAQVHRILADDGTLWLNLGDTYAAKQRGSDAGWDKSRLNNPGRVQKAQFASLREGRHTAFDRPYKNLLGMPWRIAFALQDLGWILRSEVIWSKTNCMPESVKDRVANRHEHLFMLVKSDHYWFDLDAIREPHNETTLNRAKPGRAAPGKSRREGHGIPPGNRPHTARLDQINHPEGRNPGDVWSLPTQPFPEGHFAVMPLQLAERCIAAGCKQGGVVLDPFSGSGTTGLAAAKHGRRYVGIDLNAEYLDMSLKTRLGQRPLIDGGDVA
jgi:site-specific DNA-methyltransferase (cytosine-N4-specific)